MTFVHEVITCITTGILLGIILFQIIKTRKENKINEKTSEDKRLLLPTGLE